MIADASYLQPCIFCKVFRIACWRRFCGGTQPDARKLVECFVFKLNVLCFIGNLQLCSFITPLFFVHLSNGMYRVLILQVFGECLFEDDEWSLQGISLICQTDSVVFLYSLSLNFCLHFQNLVAGWKSTFTTGHMWSSDEEEACICRSSHQTATTFWWLHPSSTSSTLSYVSVQVHKYMFENRFWRVSWMDDVQDFSTSRYTCETKRTQLPFSKTWHPRF